MFYYNKYKENRKNLEVRKEVFNNILYNIKISGDKFNINQVEQRIRKLFIEYEDLEYDDTFIRDNYSNIIEKYNKSYNEKYLISFLAVSDKVKEELEKENLGISVIVRIVHKKHKLFNKVEKRLPKFIGNYDLLIGELNKIICSKGDTLLNCLSRIIDNIDSFTKVNSSKFNTYKNKYKFNVILNGNSAKYSKYDDVNLVFKENMRNLRAICLNVYGLSILVINHENLYSNYFFSQKPSDFNIFACSKQRYLDYSSKQKKLIMSLLDVEILLFSKSEQLNNCMVEDRKEIIRNKITDLVKEKKRLETELFDLNSVMKFEPVIRKDMVDYLKVENLHSGIDRLYKYFCNATKIKDKKKNKKTNRFTD